MLPKNYTLLSAGDMSDDIESSAIDLTFYFGVAIQAIWTGIPTGAIKLQASNNNGTTWDDIADSSQTISGAAGSFLWNVWQAYYQKIRVVYTFTSDTGSLSVQVNGKGM